MMPTKKTRTPDLRDIKVGDHTYFFSEVAQRRLISSSMTMLLFMLLLFLPFLINPQAKALALTWDGGGVDNNWSTCENWSSDTCPGSGDALTFNSTSTKDSVVDASFGGVITSINITTGYSGTVSLSRSLQTSSTFTHSVGTFTANAETLDVNGAFSTTGGTFNASSGTMFFGSSFTTGASATFNHNSGTITIDTANGSTITCNSKTYNLVTFAHSSTTKTVSSGCNLPLGNNPTIGSGTAAITLNGTVSGTGTLTMSGGLTINSTGALSGFSGLTSSGALIVTGATANFSSYTTFSIGGATTIQTSANVTLPSDPGVNGTFALSTLSTLSMPAGNVTFASTLTLNSGTTFNANSGTVVIDGTASITITCNGLAFNLVSFAHTSGTKTVASTCSLPLGANPTIPSAINLNGTFSGTGTLTTNGTFSMVSGSSLSGFSGLVTAIFNSATIIDFSRYTTVDINSNFNLSGGTFTAPI